ncbi:MAG: alpha-glucosidase C-terminal domain-containing protein [Chloroflexota bacterium]
MGDNILLFDRNCVRTPMQWNNSLNGGFSDADPARLYNPVIEGCAGVETVNVASQLADPDSLLRTLAWMIKMRKTHRAFGRGSFAWAEVENRAIAAYWRMLDGECLLILNNLSATAQVAEVRLADDQPRAYIGLLSGKKVNAENGVLNVALEPYQFLWLQG